MDTARIDSRRLLAFLGAASAGFVLVLGGLAWDVAMHAGDPSLAEHESVFTLSNPSHALFAGGLAILAMGIIGAVLTATAARPDGSILRRRGVRAGIAAGSATLILAAGGLGAWAQSAMDAHSRSDAGAAGEHQSNSTHAGGAHDAIATTEHVGPHAKNLTEQDIASATPQQRAAAQKLLADTIAATRAYRDVDAAEAAGYKFNVRGKPRVYHIPNASYETDGRILDPRRPESLLYIQNPKNNSLVLVGVVFRMPRPSMSGPKPGGPITTWHIHYKCIDPAGTDSSPAKGETCPPGMVVRPGLERMHVWFTDELITAFSQKTPFRAIMAYQQGVGAE